VDAYGNTTTYILVIWIIAKLPIKVKEEIVWSIFKNVISYFLQTYDIWLRVSKELVCFLFNG
jgi:hypothetical protein